MNPTFDSMMKAMGFKRCTCKDCKFQSKSMAYPQVRCNLLGDFMAPQFKCQWFDRKAAQCRA